MISSINIKSPSTMLPHLVTPRFQDVEFLDYIGTLSKVGDIGDYAVNISKVDSIYGDASVAQKWISPTNVTLTNSIKQMPLYTLSSSRAHTNQEESRFEKLFPGVGLVEFEDAMIQASINQKLLIGTIKGFGANEGLLSDVNETPLPADSAGANTISAYIPAELAQVLASEVAKVFTATYNQASNKKIIVSSSYRVINHIKSVLVALNSAQAEGAGTMSIAGTINQAVTWLNDGKVTWIANELLGDDILVLAPELDDKPSKYSQNINVGNQLTGNTILNIVQDLVIEPSPIPFPRIEGQATLVASSAHNIRSEASSLITAAY